MSDAMAAAASGRTLTLSALERALDELADLVRGDVEPSQFFRKLLQAAVHSARADAVEVWLRTRDVEWLQLSLAVSSNDGTPERHSVSAENVPGWVKDACVSGASPPTLSMADRRMQRIVGSIRQAGQPTGVFATFFEGEATPLPSATLVSFCAALSELTGDFLVQHELRQLRAERSHRERQETWIQSIAALKRSRALAAAIAHDGRGLCGAERLTVFAMRGIAPRALAVSGVDTLDPRSATLLALEHLAATALHAGVDRHSFPAEALTSPIAEAWTRLKHASGAKTAVLRVWRSPRGDASGILIGEHFQDDSTTAMWLRQTENLASAVAPYWTTLVEADRPWWRRGPRVSRNSRLVFRVATAIMALGLISAALTAIPAEMTIHAEGQLLPARRREVFATVSGLVSAVDVEHGDHVIEGQPLLSLRDPAQEMEATRIAGELATVRARLSTVQAARITATVSSDSALRPQQLSGDEEDLKQQLLSLTQQQELLEAERQAWALKSPLAGEVLTWDVSARLAGRPVERGQVLLTVGDTSGPWVVEARIRERDLRHVFSAGGPTGLPVEFLSASESGRVCRGTVASISRVATIDDRGDSTVRMTIAIADEVPQPRPGATVWPKVRCGRQSLGYVWFKNLLDTLRRQIWLWW